MNQIGVKIYKMIPVFVCSGVIFLDSEFLGSPKKNEKSDKNN